MESIVLNIQGDEPLLRAEWLDHLVQPLLDDPAVDMSTLRTPIADPRELADPNVVKVVCREDSTALYFSRSRIPFPRHGDAPAFKHVGLYGYRRRYLLRLAGLPASALERAESLEQLRALEAGALIAVPCCDIETIAVDRPQDIARVEAVLRSRNRIAGAQEVTP